MERFFVTFLTLAIFFITIISIEAENPNPTVATVVNRVTSRTCPSGQRPIRGRCHCLRNKLNAKRDPKCVSTEEEVATPSQNRRTRPATQVRKRLCPVGQRIINGKCKCNRRGDKVNGSKVKADCVSKEIEAPEKREKTAPEARKDIEQVPAKNERAETGDSVSGSNESKDESDSLEKIIDLDWKDLLIMKESIEDEVGTIDKNLQYHHEKEPPKELDENKIFQENMLRAKEWLRDSYVDRFTWEIQAWMNSELIYMESVVKTYKNEFLYPEITVKVKNQIIGTFRLNFLQPETHCTTRQSTWRYVTLCIRPRDFVYKRGAGDLRKVYMCFELFAPKLKQGARFCYNIEDRTYVKDGRVIHLNGPIGIGGYRTVYAGGPGYKSFPINSYGNLHRLSEADIRAKFLYK